MVARATVAGRYHSQCPLPLDTNNTIHIFQLYQIGSKRDALQVKFFGNCQDSSSFFSMQKDSSDGRSSIPMYSMRSITKHPNSKKETYKKRPMTQELSETLGNFARPTCTKPEVPFCLSFSMTSKKTT